LLRIFGEERNKVLARNKYEKLPVIPFHLKVLQSLGMGRDRNYYLSKLNDLNERLNDALKQNYPARRFDYNNS